MIYSHNTSKNKRIKVIVITFSILIILSFIDFNNSLISIINSNEEKQFNDDLNDFKNPKINSNGPNARPLLIYQHATISNTFLPLSLPQNVSFTLSENWISKNVTLYYDGVSHKKDWIINGTFDTGVAPWQFITSDITVIESIAWQPEYVGIEIAKNKLVPKGAYGFYEDNFTIAEPLASNTIATLSMRYKHTLEAGGSISNENISAFISIAAGNVQKNISIPFIDLVKNYWTEMSVTYDLTNIGQQLPNNITVRAGVYVHNETQTSPKIHYLYLDDIKFQVWTEPNEKNLIIAKDVDFNVEYGYQNITYGKGKTFIDIERNSTVTRDVKFTISKNLTITNELFIYNITIVSQAIKIFNSTINGQTGSLYLPQTDINWKIECSISIPYGYINNWVEIKKPIDWNVTSVLNGYGVEKKSSCIGIEYGSDSLIIPIGELSTGFWTVQAIGVNYISKGTMAVWNGTHHNEEYLVSYGDNFLIKVSLNETISLTNTQINCTIEYPNGTIFNEIQKEPLSYDVDLEDFTVGDNMSVGEYQVSIIWTNNQSYLRRDKVGFSQFSFKVWHHTNLTAINSYVERVSGEPLLIRVKYVDLDFNKNIDFATVTYNSTFGTFGNMVYIGSGVYVIDVDSSGLGVGDYYFSFNASKSYYENQSIANLIHLKIIIQPLELEVPHTIINALANDYAICQINVTGAISGTLLPGDTNITTDWMNPYSVTNISTGIYELNFSTYNIPSQGITEVYTVTIFANKTDYGSTTGFISIQVQPLAAAVNLNQSIVNVLFNESFYLKLNYSETGTGELIAGAQLNVTWTSTYTIYPVSDGFIVFFSTVNLSIDIYTIIFQLSHPGYETTFEKIFVNIGPKLAYIELYLNQEDRTTEKTITIESNEDLNITVLCKDSLTNNFISGAMVELNGPGVSRILNENGQQYETNLSAGSLPIGIHFPTITINKENYFLTSETFKIVVEQVEISVGTIGFKTSLDVYAGSTQLIKINLTEQNTGILIPNANISFLWRYSTELNYFEDLGDGTYQIQINIPSSASGSFRVDLLISVEEGFYKITEFSFLIVVLQESTGDNTLVWIVSIILLSVIGVLGALIARSYFFLPRKRQREREFLDKIQVFKDLANIQGIMLIQRNSGMPVFTKNVSEFNFEENVLISGFIQAITLFGEQSIIVDSLKDKEKKKTKEIYSENIIELNFKFFHLLICDYQCLRTLLILKEASSEKLKNQLYLLSLEICSKFSEDIDNYKGRAIDFEEDIEILLNKFLFLYYHEPFIINQSEKYLETVKKSRELEAMESRVLNVIIALTKFSKEFTLDRIIKEIGIENLDLIYGGLQSLIENKIIIPVYFKNDQPNSLPSKFIKS